MLKHLLQLTVSLLGDDAGLRLLYRLGFAPVAGGSPEGEGDGDGGDGEDGGGDREAAAGDSGDGEDNGESGEGSSDDLARRLRRAEARAKEAESRLTERETKQAEESGEYERLYNEAKERLDTLELEVETERREARGAKIAADLKFRDPSVALRLVDVEELQDDQSARTALRKVARDHPYLLADGDRRPQGAVAGGNGEGSAGGMNALLRQAAGRAP